MTMSLKYSSSVAALLLLIGVGLTGCVGIATAPAPAIQQQVEAARTPADHQALASYYVKQATTARARAEEHRQMGKNYRRTMAAETRGSGGMLAHCNATAASYEDIASRYDAMTSEHRQLASQATK